MDAFDRQGLGAGLEVFDALPVWIERHADDRTSCALDSVAGFLRYFVRGLGGRALSIASDAIAYTDSAHIFLPPLLASGAARGDNARLYKATAVFLWAQNRYGTWQQRALDAALRMLDADTTWPVYRKLEAVRLEACLARDLPGLARDMAGIAFADPAAAAAWTRFAHDAAALTAPGAEARDSLALVAAFATRELPAAPRYSGEMLPLKVREVLAAEGAVRARARSRPTGRGRRGGDEPDGGTRAALHAAAVRRRREP
jgi:nitric oxide reductase NorD protein